MGLINDIKLFFEWKNSLNKNLEEFKTKFNVKVDRASRIHFVINIPTEMIEEPYNLRKGDLDILLERRIKNEISDLSKYLDSIGLKELYDYYAPIKKLDKYSYLVIIGFKLIDSLSVSQFIFWSKIVLTLTSISTILYFLI